MATLDWHCRHRAGVTFVELVVTTAVTERIRIESELTPVWPPRREGVPLEGWDERGYEGIVSPEGRTLLGYATPADPADPPASLTTLSPAPTDAEDLTPEATGRENLGRETAHSSPELPSPDAARSLAPADLVRTLGRAAPPRDAVPAPRPSDPPDPAGIPADGAATDPVEAWLDTVESQLETVEKLGAATTTAGVRAGVADLENARVLPERLRSLERELDTLARVHRRSKRLRDRIEAVDVPLCTFERTT